MTLDFVGQVAIVTGAGNGMGRIHALELARRGARVVVNDPAGDDESGAAAKVVDEIHAAGGDAYGDTTAAGSWEASHSIVDRAVDTWGRMDVLINNGGIALSGPIDSMSEEEHDRGLLIDLHGPFSLTRSVWPIMRDQNYGRIVNVSSGGALGQGNISAYATAKAGLWGLTFDTAQEGRQYGILVNAIMPVAWTAMTQGGPKTDFTAWLERYFPPEPITAAVVYLASSESSETGRIFSVGGGRVAEMQIFEPNGYVNGDLTPENLRQNIASALAEGGQRVRSNMEDLQAYMSHFPFESASSVEEGMNSVGEAHRGS